MEWKEHHPTWWVRRPVLGGSEEGAHDGHPVLEESGDHLYALWPQELKQLQEDQLKHELLQGQIKETEKKYKSKKSIFC